MKKITQTLALLFTFSAVVFFTSCDTDPDPGVAEIRVVNSEGITQQGILVRMFCTEPGCVVERLGRTNSLGVYTESFELPVVLRVRAVRYDTTVTVTGLPPNEIEKIKVDSLCGEGFVQVENDEIVKETITILECN
ncbi:MAG: hypothetical protein WEC59_06010 [Salibacteraceae bacterium]